MRIMDLGKINVPLDYEGALGRYRTRLRSGLPVPTNISASLISYIAWPNSEESRSSWMRAILARKLEEGGALPHVNGISKFGGLEAIVAEAFDSAGGRLASLMKRWTVVADVMQTLVDLHYSDVPMEAGASISKAIEVRADDPLGKSEGEMRRQWGYFRDVAHLIAAGAHLASEVSESDSTIFSAVWHAPESLVAIAAGYERFGLSFVAHGQNESILPPATTWRLPAHCVPPKPWIHRRELSSRHKQVLSTYKARKTYVAKS